MSIAPRLIVNDGVSSWVLVIEKPLLTIGRASTADLRLSGSHVSRLHAEITIENGACVVRDKQSRFGTFVNGERVTERTLVDGNQIQFGESGHPTIVFRSSDEPSRRDEWADSDMVRAVVIIERSLTDHEYYQVIARTLENDTVHCPRMDSAELSRQLHDSRSAAFQALRRGFYHVVEFDAQAGCDSCGEFDLTRFLAHISQRMSEAFGLRLPRDEFHPEEVSQVLKDEQKSLFCFLNVNVIPDNELRGLRGFGQEHHRMLLCGAHPLDGVKAKSVDRVERHTVPTEFQRVFPMIEQLRALASGAVVDEVLAIVLDSAVEVTGAERGFIMLATEGGRLEVKLGRMRGKITIPESHFETSRKIPEEVFATGELRIVADLLDGDLANAHMETVALGIRHVLCVPVRPRRYDDRTHMPNATRVIGVLYLDSREKGPLISSETRAVLELMATEAGAAISLRGSTVRYGGMYRD